MLEIFPYLELVIFASVLYFFLSDLITFIISIWKN